MKSLTLLLAVLTVSASALVAAPPNVILMMADDMGMGDTSAYQDFTGNPDGMQIDTPQMERLARMGVRFTDAHTPASRCSPTRYGLLTGRYPWRTRLKWYVLFGSQGDPLIEPGRPTLATLFKDNGYATGLVGKWHVGLRYRNTEGKPAAGFIDADLTTPLHTTPLDHGFDFARFTSRSHATSGPDAGNPGQGKKGKANRPDQNIGPGHIHGRRVIGATENGRELVADGPNAYFLTELGSRHSDHAIQWLDEQVAAKKPFFLYYPSNSNHGPYTPDEAIGGKPVKGAARTVSGDPMDDRHDYIHENDVALGRLLDYLEATDDPRNPGQKLVANTIVIFTSDNGAEKNSPVATGPFRSNKGSCYEGGHRVAFLASWPEGDFGDGDADTPGKTNETPLGLCDLFATFSEILETELPDLKAGEKGAEDSTSVLAALQGEELKARPPLFFSDHKEAKDDPAVLAMRLDHPSAEGKTFEGQWKIFFKGSLARAGRAEPFELYELSSDPGEENNRLGDPELAPLVAHLQEVAYLHRNAGAHRLAEASAEGYTVQFDWSDESPAAEETAGKLAKDFSQTVEFGGNQSLTLTISGDGAGETLTFSPNPLGLGLAGGGKFNQVDEGEAFLLSFDRDVVLETAAIVAGKGVCGGFYRVGDHEPLAIYCVDGDNDSREQHGLLSDLGVLKKGQTLHLDSSPHYGVEPSGRWRLGALTVRVLANE
ncbi:MAG: sulfatase-like hydrolase/transferase [Verrucomicrobiota bacterium]